MPPAGLLTSCTKLLHPPPPTPLHINLFHPQPPYHHCCYRPHGLQNARLPCHHQLLELAQTRVHRAGDAIQPSQSLPPPFSSCFQSFSASGSFPMSWLLASGGRIIGASASTSVLPMNLQVFPYHGYTSYFINGSAPTLTGHPDQPSQDSCSHTHPSVLCAWVNFHGTHHQTNHVYLTTC